MRLLSFATIWKKGKVLIISLTGLLAGIFVYLELYDRTKSEIQTPHEKFMEEQYVEGIVIPYDVQKAFPMAAVYVGNESYGVPFDSLRNGKDFTPYLIQCGFDSNKFESTLPIVVRLKGDKLYVSSTFYDLNNLYLGELHDEKWKLFKNAIADYTSGKRYLEVIDHYNNIVFSLVYERDNIIRIKGYHWGKACACVSAPREEGGLHLYYSPGPNIRDSIIRYARKLTHIGVSKFDPGEVN